MSLCLVDDLANHDIFLVLDPTRKLDYLDAAWDQEYIDKAMNQMKKIVAPLLLFVKI